MDIPWMEILGTMWTVIAVPLLMRWNKAQKIRDRLAQGQHLLDRARAIVTLLLDSIPNPTPETLKATRMEAARQLAREMKVEANTAMRVAADAVDDVLARKTAAKPVEVPDGR